MLTARLKLACGGGGSVYQGKIQCKLPQQCEHTSQQVFIRTPRNAVNALVTSKKILDNCFFYHKHLPTRSQRNCQETSRSYQDVYQHNRLNHSGSISTTFLRKPFRQLERDRTAQLWSHCFGHWIHTSVAPPHPPTHPHHLCPGKNKNTN